MDPQFTISARFPLHEHNTQNILLIIYLCILRDTEKVKGDRSASQGEEGWLKGGEMAKMAEMAKMSEQTS